MKFVALGLLACVIAGFGMGMTALTGKFDPQILRYTFLACVIAACGIPYFIMKTWKPAALLVCSLIIFSIYLPFVVSGR